MSNGVTARRAERRRTGRLVASAVIGLTGLLTSGGLVGDRAEAKTPGQTYCFLGVCHRVKTLAETRALVGKTHVVHASYYFEAGRDRFNPSNITSSGEYFRASRPDNAASPILPNGTKLLVWHPLTKQAVVVRINNAGPYWGRRTLDLSRGAAERLGMAASGVGTVMTRVLQAPTPLEATYRRGRTYTPVPGHLGHFASLELAQQQAVRLMGRELQREPEPMLPVEIAREELAPPPELGDYVVAGRSEPVVLASMAVASAAARGQGRMGRLVDQVAAAMVPATGPTVRPPAKAAAAVPVRAQPGKPRSAGSQVAKAEMASGSRAAPRLSPPRNAAASASAVPQVRLPAVNQPARVQVAELPRRAAVTAAAAPVVQPAEPPPADMRWVSRVLTLQRE